MGIYEKSLHGFLVLFVLWFVWANVASLPSAPVPKVTEEEPTLLVKRLKEAVRRTKAATPISLSTKGRLAKPRQQQDSLTAERNAAAKRSLAEASRRMAATRNVAHSQVAKKGEAHGRSNDNFPAATTEVQDILISKRDNATRLYFELADLADYEIDYKKNERTLTLTLFGVTNEKVASSFPPLAIVESVSVKGGKGRLPLQVNLSLAADVVLQDQAQRKGKSDKVVLAFTRVQGKRKEDEQLLTLEQKTLGEGLNYCRHRFKAKDGASSDVHVLRLSLASREFGLGLKLGQSTILGKERLSSIAKKSRAVAAVNASFFAGSGEPLGLISDGRKLLSVPIYRRSCFGIFNGKAALLGNPGFSGKLDTDFGEFYLTGINQSGSGARNKLLVYTPQFGASTHTNGAGLEMAISGGRVVALQEADTAIPPDGFVVGLRGVPSDAMKSVKFWDKVKYRWGLTPPWDVSDFAVGGGPRLLTDGEVTVNWKEERFQKSFATTRAPRTAVGVAEDGSVLLLVADGRDKPRNIGLSLYEAARVLRRLGCKEGLNLDGGGSTAMWVEGKIVNHPSDGRERAISSALVLTRRHQGAAFARSNLPSSAVRGT